MIKPNTFFELYLQEEPTNSAAGGNNGSAIAGIGQKGPEGSAANFGEPPGQLAKLKRTLFRRKKNNDGKSRD